MSANYDQSEIEKTLRDMVKQAAVSENIFCGVRPKNTDKKMEDFVVVKVTGGITDMAAYGNTTCSIDLYVRDVGGIKNGAKLSAMFRKIDELIPRQQGKLLLNNMRVIADVPDGYGFTVRMINIGTIIQIN